MSPNTVIVALGGALTTTERNLVTIGMDDLVLQVRYSLQTAMRDDLILAVEQALGRRVLALLSDTEVHADLAIQVFTLVPADREMGARGSARLVPRRPDRRTNDKRPPAADAPALFAWREIRASWLALGSRP